MSSLGAQTPVSARGAPSAADSLLESQTRALASQLRCPVCQGLSIEDSPSELSQQMRNVVRDQLRAGRSPEEVKQYFVSKYGEWILLSPRASGVNTLIYALPLLALIGGAGLVIISIGRWTRASSAKSGDGADTPENDQSKQLASTPQG
jgi:cytochrome c-type biogenesis protein CcmH